MKVAVFSESTNDSKAVISLLQQRNYTVQFKPILKVKGDQIETLKAARALALELESGKYSFTIYIRDLDAPHTDAAKRTQRTEWFNNLNNTTGNKGVFLLNIYELEALILADIDTFNKDYGTSIKFISNPMHLANPKEFLQDKTYKAKKRYEENHCPDLFSRLDIHKLINRENFYFKDFIDKLEARIKEIE